MRTDEAIEVLYMLMRHKAKTDAVREALRMAVEALKREEDDLK